MATSREADAFDIVVIGSGPAGYVGAIQAAQLGLRVAVVEKDGAYGGTCLHRGCIPTKALLETAHLLEKMRHAAAFGVRVGDVALDLEAAHTYKAGVVNSGAKGIHYLFRKYGVTGVHGWGRLDGGGRVRVHGDTGAERLLTARRGVLLATGSACKHLPFIEMDQEQTLDSDHILELRTVPRHLIVIGAGAVGVEFASIFLRFGAEVTLVEILDRVLPLEDEAISQSLEKALARQGMRILTGSRVDRVRRSRQRVSVELRGSDGETQTLSADRLLVATGRRPLTADIGLDTTAIELDRNGFVPVDAVMQTPERGVYAAGDIVATPMLAHLGSHEAILAVEHMAGRQVRPIRYDRVPNCTYCDPEVASVGLTEQQAREQGYAVRTSVFPFSASTKAKILGETEGLAKIVGESRHDEVLGLHIVGPRATELIAEGVTALNLEATAAEIMHTIHPHPTLSEVVGEVGHGLALGQPLHV